MLDSAERARLEALHALGVLDTPPEERFDRVVRLAQRLFQVPMAAVSLVDRDRQWFKSRFGVRQTETRREDAFCNQTIRQPGPLVVPDAAHDERFADNPLVTGEPFIRFYAGRPLLAPGGHRVGAVCIMDHEPRDLTPDEVDLLGDLAGWLEHELALRDELERAEQVQRGLLPRAAPVVPGYEVAGGCIPASEVGGDFFDWYPVGDQLQLTVADVMGKGVGSAIIAATVRAMLRSTSRGANVGPAVVSAARGLELDLDETSSFVTMFTARLDALTGHVTYVDAGHGLTLLVDANGKPEHLPSEDLPIGAELGSTWRERHIDMRPGDTLITVSDGLLDFFKTAFEVLEAASIVVRATTTAQEVIDEITRFAKARRVKDDITALVVRRNVS